MHLSLADPSCFHLLAVVSNAVMDILLVGMLPFLLGIHVGIELLGHMETLCLTV